MIEVEGKAVVKARHTTQSGGFRAMVCTQDLVLRMVSHTAASYLPMPLTATICVCPPETNIPMNGNWHIITQDQLTLH